MVKPRDSEFVFFGKYRGKKWTEVPSDYLAWMCRTDSDPRNNFPGMKQAVAKWRRRGLPPQLVLTPHALERAHQRLADIYTEKAMPGESVENWLRRVFLGVVSFGKVEKTHKSRKGKVFKYTRYEYVYKGGGAVHCYR